MAKNLEKIDNLDLSIGQAQKHFDVLSTTRVKQIEKLMEKILELQMANLEIKN